MVLTVTAQHLLKGLQNIQQVPHLFSVAELFQDDSLRLTEDSPLARSRKRRLHNIMQKLEQSCNCYAAGAAGLQFFAEEPEEKGRYRQGIHAAVTVNGNNSGIFLFYWPWKRLNWNIVFGNEGKNPGSLARTQTSRR